MNKPFYKSKKAVMTIVGVWFSLVYIAACYKKPELIALQGFAATVILSVIGHGAFQGWVDAKSAGTSPKKENDPNVGPK